MTPHNPQQNGAAERKRKSILGVAWVMLSDQGLPLHLWVEACNTTIYLHNKILHQIPGMETLEGAFYGKRLDVGHFRIFVHRYISM